MKRLIATLLMLIAVAGCELPPMWEPVVPLPPETGPVSQNKLEVLDFYATWCGPCKLQAPRIKMLENDGYTITPIDVDKNKDKAKEYGITSVPTYVVEFNGKEEYRTQNAWKLAAYLREHHGSSVQTSKGAVRDVPKETRKGQRTGQSGSESIAGGNADGERGPGDKTVETCLIRDRHLYLND